VATVALIGFLGGLITGISPCILPVLPVVFFSGLDTTRVSTPELFTELGGAADSRYRPSCA
jgi:cytochrome c biogenesis protein CcdA